MAFGLSDSGAGASDFFAATGGGRRGADAGAEFVGGAGAADGVAAWLGGGAAGSELTTGGIEAADGNVGLGGDPVPPPPLDASGRERVGQFTA